MKTHQLASPFSRLQTILDEHKPVQQQELIEMLLATFMYRCNSFASREYLFDAVKKHTTQLLDKIEQDTLYRPME